MMNSNAELDRRAADAEVRANASRENLEAMRRVTNEQLLEKIEKLQLINEAMWEIVKAATDATDDNLRLWIEHLDASDGQTDGRKVHLGLQCESCEARVPASSKMCLFCSAPAPVSSPFAG